MTRAKLEELVHEYIDRSVEITKRALEASPFEIKDIDEIILVGGQTRMPAIVSAVKELFGKEPNKTINPDEVVADGAAIQAGIMRGEVRDVLLLDVIPLSLGIETLGGVATKLIERNTTIPTSKSQIFSTAADNQTSVDIHVVQGERAMAADNKSLGRFILEGIPPAPRGMPQIEVSFDVDANGIVSVTAKDKATGKSQSIRIEASSGLTDADIEKMTHEAKQHEEEDRGKRETAEARNTADQMIYTAEKSLKDNAGKIPDEVKKEVEEKIADLRGVKETADKAVLQSKTEALSTAMQKIGQAMAEQSKAGTAGGASDAKEEGNVRDAEVEDEDKGSEESNK
jgi:molecular chaperone DnaK